jgi:hypothetical protein
MAEDYSSWTPMLVRIATTLGARAACLYLIEDEVRVVATFGAAPDVPSHATDLAVLIESALTKRKTIRRKEATTDANLISDFAIPLHVGNKIAGVLFLTFDREVEDERSTIQAAAYEFESVLHSYSHGASEASEHATIELAFDIPEGASEDALLGQIQMAATLADSLHRALGGSGLVVEDLEVYRGVMVPEAAPNG